MLDVIIANGLVVDGSGTAPFLADVGVKDGRIAEIAPHIRVEAKQVIDATRLQVTPGFIDSHTHSDNMVFFGSSSYHYLEQGVTLQIAGQCGSSPAPFSPKTLENEKGMLSAEVWEEYKQIALSPSSFMEAAEKKTYGTNIAFFLGHGAVRGNVMGFSPASPTEGELSKMKAIVNNAMESGYLGMSSGLIYAPSAYAKTEELIALSKVIASYGGVYASHIRGEGTCVLTSLREAISIGEKAGCAVLISHLKVLGARNEGLSAVLLEEIDKANARGVPVFADQYPYTASSNDFLSQIPPEYLAEGKEKLLEQLEKPDIREKILFAMFHPTEEFESSLYSAGFEGSLVTEAEQTPEFVNLTISQIAAETGKTPIDAMCDLLLANEGRASGCYFNQNASDLLRIMKHPKVFCGSDYSDFYKRIEAETEGGSHPRAVGTMVRRLELVRDFRLRTMEESIANVTWHTARAMGIEERGLLKEGMKADICVIDYDRLHATADYIHPFRPNEGIHYVFVNGAVAVEKGIANGKCCGEVVKKSRV